MPNSPLWFVRAGEGAIYAADFRSSNSVGIGWIEVGPISADTPDEEIDERFSKTYPDKEPRARGVWANQVRRYLREIRVGDGVATYDPTERAYLLGQIDSDTEWKDGPLSRRRTVTWTHRVDRDALSRPRLQCVLARGTCSSLYVECEWKRHFLQPWQRRHRGSRFQCFRPNIRRSRND
jgi:predicted Mrr-cat superfamily restriction endonuclease